MIERKKLCSIFLTLAFLLGAKDGYIALWRAGEKDPLTVFPYRVASLPRADQNALNEGIYLASEEELRALIEDYLS